MDKNIKYLIENIVNFNPVDYQDNESEMINRNTLNDILQVPKTKEELIKIIKQRIKENKFGNKNLYYPDLSDIDTSNITDMSNLFNKILARYGKPIKLDLSNWYVSEVTNMKSMFQRCSSLQALDLSGWDMSNVTDMNSMFYGCKRAIIPHWY